MCSAYDMPTYDPQVQLRARALGDPTRYRIFRYVLEADHPVGVAELTSYVQLNHNAVRQHLAVLTKAEFLFERAETRGRPGRPRLLYEPNLEQAIHWGLKDPYEYLAALLVEALGDNDSLTQVGANSGLKLASSSVPVNDVKEALSAFKAHLAQLGFHPTLREGLDTAEANPVETNKVAIVLNNCPFKAVAKINPTKVCKLHRGIADGLAKGTGFLQLADMDVRDPSTAGCTLWLQMNSVQQSNQ